MKAQTEIIDMTNVDLGPMAEYINGVKERAEKLQELFKTDPEKANEQVRASWEPFVKRINKAMQTLNK